MNCEYCGKPIKVTGAIHDTATRVAVKAKEQELADAYAAIRALMQAGDRVNDRYPVLQPFLVVVIKHRDTIGRALDAKSPNPTGQRTN